MARVNVGVNPKLLTDQWLVAESVEITMITGGLRKNNFQIKSEIPNNYCLGKGHINFFKNKLLYLYRRLAHVNNEMINRGFRPGTHFYDIGDFPKEFHNDWQPNINDSLILRNRLECKIRAKPDQWRYNRNKITDINSFINDIRNSDLYYV